MKIVKAVYFALALTGCDTVEISERVIYEEDKTPVQFAKVVQTGYEYKGITYTDTNGEWTLHVPADAILTLCIDNPRDRNIPACFDEAYLLSPTVESGLNQMIKVEK